MKIATVALILVFPALAEAQATVEAAAAAGHAATAVGAAGSKLSKGIGGALDKLNGTLEKAGKGKTDAKGSQVVTPPAVQGASAPTKRTEEVEKAPEIQYESPLEIREGIELAELTRRFGPPALKIATGADQELYCYAAKDGTSVDVSVRSNKVVAIQKKAPANAGGGLKIQ